MKLYEKKEDKYVYKYKKLDIKNLTEEEIICTYAFQLSILNNAEYDNLLCLYNFGNYGEQMVNIYKNEELWEVSIGDKRHSFEKRTFDNCVLAYMYALQLLSDSKEEIQRLLSYFYDYLMKDYTKEQLGNCESLYLLSSEEKCDLLKNDTIDEHYSKVRNIRRRILQKYED